MNISRQQTLEAVYIYIYIYIYTGNLLSEQKKRGAEV